jgi:hypothetical protein
LREAVGEADVISCATLSATPVIAGQWLRLGQHLDLVGAFNLRMREADDEALRRARIFVDTEAALSEGGDVAIGLASGAIGASDVVAGGAGPRTRSRYSNRSARRSKISRRPFSCGAKSGGATRNERTRSTGPARAKLKR